MRTTKKTHDGTFDAGASLDIAIRVALLDAADLPSLPADFAGRLAAKVASAPKAIFPRWIVRTAATIAVAAGAAWAAVEIAAAVAGGPTSVSAETDATERVPPADATERVPPADATSATLPGGEEGRGKREEVRGKREEGRGNGEEGRGNGEEGRDASATSATATGAPCIISNGKNKTGLDSGYRYNALSRIEVDYAFDAIRRLGMRLFGADREITSDGTSVSFGIDEKSGDVVFVFSDADWPTENVVISTGMKPDRLRRTVVIDQKNNVAHCIAGATTNKTVAIPGVPAAEADLPVALFGDTAYSKGERYVYSGYGYSAKARIYRARFYTDDVLVRDLVPVVRDGVPGFRDLVGGGFVGPDETIAPGVFTASPSTPEDTCDDPDGDID